MSLQEAWERHSANWVRWARAPDHDSYWRFRREPFRRRFDETVEHDGMKIRFLSWCYPLEGYAGPLLEAGFLIEAMREPAVDRSAFTPHGERRLRIPNFLMLRAVKPA